MVRLNYLKTQADLKTEQFAKNAQKKQLTIAEKEIELNEAKQLLKLCEKGVIEKTRYEVKSGNHTIEIDEFHGDNNGLIIAEIELEDENESIEKPHWLGNEVTNDERYYNSYISLNPFKYW